MMFDGLKGLQMKIYFNLVINEIIFYALHVGLAHEKFDILSEVAPQSKFPCGPLDLNSWVDPN